MASNLPDEELQGALPQVLARVEVPFERGLCGCTVTIARRLITNERQPDQRRHPRANVRWPVVVEAGGRTFQLETVNISSRGAKVRPKEELGEGSLAELHFHPPGDRVFDVSAIVWRVDLDGLAFFFFGDSVLDPTQYSSAPA